MENKRTDIQHLIDELSQYLLANPHASDSLSGIQRWWLGKRSKSELPNTVEAALVTLVQRGQVERIEVHGSDPIYRAVKRTTTTVKHHGMRKKT